MELVKQRNSIDCGICCLAMLAHISYEKASRILFPEGRIRRTCRDEMRQAFAEFPVNVGRGFVSWERNPRNIREVDLEFNALLQTALIGQTVNWHWLVWDATQRIVIDPSGRRPRRRIAAYLKADT